MVDNTAPRLATGDGKALTSLASGSGEVRSAALQSDGKIVLGGLYYNGSDTDFALVRYNADGSLDTSFGTNGQVFTPVGTGTDDQGYSVAIQSDGRILLGGYTYKESGSTSLDFAVVRYNPNGTLDTGFGSGGKAVVAVGTSNDVIWSVVLQPDNKILLGGYTYVGSNVDFALARLNTNGSLDSGFGSGGKVSTGISTSGTKDDIGSAVAFQPDGNGGFKIIMAGRSRIGADDDFSLVRYNSSNGSLDSTFGSGGKTTMNFTFGPNAHDSGRAVVVLPDGKIVMGGYTATNGTDDFALARFKADGSLDPTFGTNGRVATPLGSSADRAYSMVLQPDGKILLGGLSLGASSNDFALVRYNENGSLDTGFGSGGKVVTQVGVFGAPNDTRASVMLQPDGKILLSASGVTDYDFGLVRYNADGSLDLTFGTSRFTEGGAAVVADGDVSVYDTNLAPRGNYGGASLTLMRDGAAQGEDVFGAAGSLSALVQGGVLKVSGITVGTVTQNSGGALALSFNSSATEALIDKALRQITYANTSDAPPGAVSLRWTFSDGNTDETQGDGGQKSASAVSTVFLTGVNDAPVLVQQIADQTVSEDTGWSFTLPAGTFADPDSGLSLSASLTGGAALSSVGLAFDSATRTFSGTPPANFNGNLSIDVTASDGQFAASDTFILAVTPVNDAAVIGGDLSPSLAEINMVLSATGQLTVSDIDSPASFQAGTLKGSQGGMLTLAADGAWSYEASSAHNEFAAGNTYADTFIVQAADGTGTALSVNIAGTNDAPVITSGRGSVKADYAVAENKTAVAALRASDAEGAKLTWSIAGGKDAKLFAINSKSGSLAFKAAPDFESPKDVGKNNVYDVTVRVSDGAAFDSQALKIKVTDVKGIAKAGTAKANALLGTKEADTLKGFGGNDRLTGGGGADKLYGGDGKRGIGLDTFVFKAAGDSTVEKAGRDTIFDFAHGDRIDLSGIDANGLTKGSPAFTFIGDKAFGGHKGELRFDKLPSDTVIYADLDGNRRADMAIHLDDAVKMLKGDFIL